MFACVDPRDDGVLAVVAYRHCTSFNKGNNVAHPSMLFSSSSISLPLALALALSLECSPPFGWSQDARTYDRSMSMRARERRSTAVDAVVSAPEDAAADDDDDDDDDGLLVLVVVVVVVGSLRSNRRTPNNNNTCTTVGVPSSFISALPIVEIGRLDDLRGN